MPFSVENPAALALLLALPGMYLLGRGRLSLMSPWRRRAILVVRVLMMSALILALAAPTMLLNDATMSVAFLIDVSSSISPGSRPDQEEWVRQAIDQKRSADQAAVVLFAGQPEVARPLGRETNFRMQANANLGDGTNLAAGLRLASGLLPASGLRKVVLLSDGWDTAGSLERTARSLPAGTRVDVVPWPAMQGQPEVLIESLDVASYLREGDGFDVTAVVGSNHDSSARLRVLVDGQSAGQWDLQLGNGANLVTMPQKALPLGSHSIEVELGAENDTVAENNRSASLVVVKPRGHVLLVEGNPGSGSHLRQELAGSGLQVDRILVGEVPLQMPFLLLFDAVVLDDVPGPSLSLDQIKTLDSYVKDQGRGLLVVGGKSSYGLGDYISTPLEDMLPVSSDVPLSRERAEMALVLVIDRSGSMDDASNGVTKIAMAREAAIQATGALKPEDQLGVIAFDTQADWIVPIEKVGTNLGSIGHSISSLQSSGGTDIHAALQSAYAALQAVPAANKHITLLTDGQSWKGAYQSLLQQVRQANITLSTIGIGSDADTQWLSELANLGDGRYYFTERFTDIPKIVYREVSAATRVAEVNGKIDPLFTAPSPVLRGMNREGIPSLSGYVATKSKEAATTVLRSDRGDPLLSQWQYGLGRVVAWMSDSEGVWTTGWLSEPQFGHVWDQAVRWSMSPPVNRGLQVTSLLDGDRATITAESVDGNSQFVDLAETSATVWDPDGNYLTVPLPQTAPGRYQASLTATTPGLYQVIVNQARGGQAPTSEITGYAVPAATEFRGLGSNDALLKELASTSTGRAVRDPSDAFSRQGMPSTPGWEPLWPYLLAAALLLLPVEIALRRIRSLPFSRQEDEDSEETTGEEPPKTG